MHVRRLFIATFAVLICAACDDGAPPSNSGPAAQVPRGSIPASEADIQTLAAGLETPGVNAVLAGEGDNQLLLLELDTKVLEPMLIGQPQAGISARAALDSHQLAVVIGSGFVSALNSLEPVGLLQLDGRTLSPVLGHGYTRILGINDQGMGVVHRSTYESHLFHSALQAGPGIVEGGLLDISERDLKRPKYFRSFVALCEGRWLAGVSLAPSHLRTLGETLLSYLDRAGLRCDEVVNLAGDREAVLLVRSRQDTIVYHGDPDTYKVSLLGFRPY